MNLHMGFQFKRLILNGQNVYVLNH